MYRIMIRKCDPRLLIVFLTLTIFIFSLTPKEFNSYGARRGNDAVMVRGTFANIRLMNKFIGKAGPRTIYIPTKEEVYIHYSNLVNIYCESM